MARIPQRQIDSPSIPVGIGGQISPQFAASSVFQSKRTLAALANQFGDIAERAQQAEENRAFHQTIADTNRKWAEDWETAKADAPERPIGFATNLQAAYDADVEAAVQAAPERIQDQLRARLQNKATDYYTRAAAFEHTRLLNSDEASSDKIAETIAETVFRDPTYFEEGVTEFRAHIADMKTVADPVAAREWEKNGLATIAEAEISRMAQDDPEEAIKAIDTELYDEYLDTGRLSTLRGQIKARAERAQEHNLFIQDRVERIAERRLKREQAANEVDILANMLPGDDETVDVLPSENELIDQLASGVISREGFTRLNSVRKAELAGENDLETEVVLQSLALDGNEEFIPVLETAITNRTITGPTSRALMSDFAQAVKQGGILQREDVKQGFKRVEEGVAGVGGEFARLDDAASQRVLNATRLYRDRVLAAAEKGEAFDGVTVADEVAARFRAPVSDPTAYPTPIYRVGPRYAPDVIATRVRTIEAMRRGEITREQAAEEMRNLEAIEDALEAQGGVK